MAYSFICQLYSWVHLGLLFVVDNTRAHTSCMTTPEHTTAACPSTLVALPEHRRPGQLPAPTQHCVGLATWQQCELGNGNCCCQSSPARCALPASSAISALAAANWDSTSWFRAEQAQRSGAGQLGGRWRACKAPASPVIPQEPGFNPHYTCGGLSIFVLLKPYLATVVPWAAPGAGWHCSGLP